MFKKYGLLNGFIVKTTMNKISEEIKIWFYKKPDFFQFKVLKITKKKK